MATATAAPFRTVADLQKRLWCIPAERIRLRPAPGTATIQDVIEVWAREKRACELVEGILVEKPMGYSESRLAGYILTLLNNFVLLRNLGIVSGADSTLELMPDLVRIPDVAFVSWDRLPGRRGPTDPVPPVVPDLAVEVLSASNTTAEMAAKREEYFAAGVRLVWEVEWELRAVAVYTSPTAVMHLRGADVLDGGDVLPGFTLPLPVLFAELDRQG